MSDEYKLENLPKQTEEARDSLMMARNFDELKDAVIKFALVQNYWHELLIHVTEQVWELKAFMKKLTSSD